MENLGVKQISRADDQKWNYDFYKLKTAPYEYQPQEVVVRLVASGDQEVLGEGKIDLSSLLGSRHCTQTVTLNRVEDGEPISEIELAIQLSRNTDTERRVQRNSSIPVDLHIPVARGTYSPDQRKPYHSRNSSGTNNLLTVPNRLLSRTTSQVLHQRTNSLSKISQPSTAPMAQYAESKIERHEKLRLIEQLNNLEVINSNMTVTREIQNKDFLRKAKDSHLRLRGHFAEKTDLLQRQYNDKIKILKNRLAMEQEKTMRLTTQINMTSDSVIEQKKVFKSNLMNAQSQSQIAF